MNWINLVSSKILTFQELKNQDFWFTFSFVKESLVRNNETIGLQIGRHFDSDHPFSVEGFNVSLPAEPPELPPNPISNKN